MFAGLKTAGGIIRSLRIYYGDREHASAMDRLYRQFVTADDLVFDVGAHVGDRVASFRRLGARVVAVEPQPAVVRVLRLLYGRSRDVVIEPLAVGREAGAVEMMINPANPTVATASADFIGAARDAPGWKEQRWTKKARVEKTTLDLLVRKHGTPSFIKIDVEGYEAEVLAGLSKPVRALSFEFTTIQRGVAIACIERCVELGYTKFNAALGESQKFAYAEWLDDAGLRAWLNALPHSANSGDIYATL